MKIGLIDVDGHHFPNLALMKLSAYHKKQGDTVEWVNYWDSYDKVYASKVFTYTPDILYPINADELVKGGSGYRDYQTVLPFDLEHICPDYSLYPSFTSALGFLTRGCNKRCDFCIVPRKEGKVRINTHIGEFLAGRKTAILLDNNILQSVEGLVQIDYAIELGVKLDFIQGLDAFSIHFHPAIAKQLAKVKWIRNIRLACNNKHDLDNVRLAMEALAEYGVKPYKIFCYCILMDENSIPEVEYIVLALDFMGITPFVQPYRDFDNKVQPTTLQRHFARWVNHRATFKSCTWWDYCQQYKLHL